MKTLMEEHMLLLCASNSKVSPDREIPLTADLPSYPKSYTVAISVPGTPPRRLKTTSSRYKSITHLGIQFLLERIVSSLQGDDEADGRGTQQEDDDEESLGDLDHGEEFMFGQDVVTQSGSTDGGQGRSVAGQS
jgi:hypothetical protein